MRNDADSGDTTAGMSSNSAFILDLRCASFAASFVVFSAMGAHAEVNGNFIVLGEGTLPCAKWIDIRKTPETGEYFSVLSWFNGYVTATNRDSWHGSENLLQGMDSAARAAWFDDFCTRNPLATIGTAAFNFVDELKARNTTKRK